MEAAGTVLLAASTVNAQAGVWWWWVGVGVGVGVWVCAHLLLLQTL